MLARPLPDFSIPSVAEEAGVAVATVYRHFKTKPELIEGLVSHYMEQLLSAAGLALGEPPSRAGTLDELYPTLRAVFERQASLDPTMQAAFATQIADEARRAHRDERVQRIESWLASITAGMDPEDRRHVIELYVVLSSSATRRSFDVLLGASPAHAADVVAWAIKRLAAPSATG